MTHRGPFQPLLFFDFVICDSVTDRKGRIPVCIIQFLPKHKSFEWPEWASRGSLPFFSLCVSFDFFPELMFVMHCLISLLCLISVSKFQISQSILPYSGGTLGLQ